MNSPAAGEAKPESTLLAGEHPSCSVPFDSSRRGFDISVLLPVFSTVLNPLSGGGEAKALTGLFCGTITRNGFEGGDGDGLGRELEDEVEVIGDGEGLCRRIAGGAFGIGETWKRDT